MPIRRSRNEPVSARISFELRRRRAARYQLQNKIPFPNRSRRVPGSNSSMNLMILHPPRKGTTCGQSTGPSIRTQDTFSAIARSRTGRMRSSPARPHRLTKSLLPKVSPAPHAASAGVSFPEDHPGHCRRYRSRRSDGLKSHPSPAPHLDCTRANARPQLRRSDWGGKTHQKAANRHFTVSETLPLALIPGI